MISIIICSRQVYIPEILKNNIENSIGIECEFVVVNNYKNQYSIFEAYNIGISKSKGEILCFVHDDIIFHTKGWGKKLHAIFKNDPQIGLVGIAGSKMKTKMPSAWWDCPENLKIINIIQHFNEPEREKEKWYKGFELAKEVEVAVIDGVFMALKRDTNICFNTNMQGFHNYDINLALECYHKGYKVIVTNRILLEHFSIGSQEKNWYISTMKFDELYRKFLPVSNQISAGKEEILRKQEFENGVTFIKGLLKHSYKKEAIKYWWKLIFYKPYAKFHFNFLKKLIFN